jgi:phytoene dehydrogenase-like protein
VPNFIALPNSGAAHIPGPQHRGTMHICPTMDYLERAYDDAKYGRPSQSPILECTMATTVDDSLAPPGKHLMSMFVQYAPYHLREGNWDDIKESFADRCFDILNEYAPNFKQSVIARQILTPVDLERIYGLTGGNIFQGSMSLSSMFSLRPVAGFCQYRTPIAGLYLCGAAAHPGGGVLGAAGWNAAREMLRDR